MALSKIGEKIRLSYAQALEFLFLKAYEYSMLQYFGTTWLLFQLGCKDIFQTEKKKEFPWEFY